MSAEAEEAVRLWRASLGGKVFDRLQPRRSVRPPLVRGGGSDGETALQEAPPRDEERLLHPSAHTDGREYALKKSFAEGGMGVIYGAWQGSLQREVAIKKIKPSEVELLLQGFPDAHGKVVGSPDKKAREDDFVSEALVTGWLDHPNIVPAYGLGRDAAGEWFFPMKLVRGLPWLHLLKPREARRDHDEQACDLEMQAPSQPPQECENTLELARVQRARADQAEKTANEKKAELERNDPLEAHLRILLSVCNAVSFAHSKDIIHRDLKPQNVMVGAFGEVLVMDWGLAVDVSEDSGTAKASRRVPHKLRCRVGGTLEYLAPEQTMGGGQMLGFRTDVFLLGAILHEILTGRAPNELPESVPEQRLSHACDCPAPEFPDSLAAELREICTKALAKVPDDRYASVLDLKQALDGFLRHRESAGITAKADRHACENTIPSLASAVTLYGQAIDLWEQNQPALAGKVAAGKRLEHKQTVVRRVRNSAWGLAATIIVVLLGATIWISIEQAKTRSAQEKTSLALEDVKRERNEKQQQLLETQHELGKSMLERATNLVANGMLFHAKMLAARTIGYDESGGPDARFPALLKRNSPEWNQAGAFAVWPDHRLIWRSPFVLHQLGAINAALCTPDGKTLITVAGNVTPNGIAAPSVDPEGNDIVMWDLQRGAQIARLKGHSSTVLALALSKDGNTLVSGGTDRFIRVWDLTQRRELKRLETPTGLVFALALSADGGWLAALGDATPIYPPLPHLADKYMHIWDMKAGREVRQCNDPDEPNAAFSCLALSANGQLLATGSIDGRVRLWRFPEGKLIRALPQQGFDVLALAFSSDGSRLLSGAIFLPGTMGVHGLIQWDVSVPEKARKTGVFDSYPMRAVRLAYAPDGKSIAVVGEKNATYVLDAATGAERAVLAKGLQARYSLSFTPDSKNVVEGCGNGIVRLWDVATRTLRQDDLGHSAVVSAVEFTPDGRRLVSGGLDGSVRVWNRATGAQEIVLEKHKSPVTSIAITPDGRMLATACSHFVLRMLGNDRSENAVRLWDLTNGCKEAGMLQYDYGVSAVAISPDGKVLVAGLQDGTVCVNDLETRRIVKQFAAHGDTERERLYAQIGPINAALERDRYSVLGALAFSPDGRFLATTGMDKKIALWDAATWESAGSIDVPAVVTSVAFSPQMSAFAPTLPTTRLQKERDKLGSTYANSSYWHLAAAGLDGRIRLWNCITRKEVGSLPTQNTAWAFVRCSPDGTVIAAAGPDGSAQFWSALNMSLAAKSIGNGTAVNCMAFSPDGKCLAAGSDFGTINVWESATGLERSDLLGELESAQAIYSPDGAVIASLDAVGRVTIWQANNAYKTDRISMDNVQCIKFAPSGHLLACAATEERVALFDRDNEEILTLETGGKKDEPTMTMTTAMAFAPDEKFLACATLGGKILFWDIGGKRLKYLCGDSNARLFDVVFSRDGTQFMTIGGDGFVRCYATADGSPKEMFSVSRAKVLNAVFSPDASSLAVAAGNEEDVKIWDLARRVQESLPMKFIPSMGFSSDGRRLALAYLDNVDVWDRDAGRVTQKLLGHLHYVNSVAFAADGKSLVTTSKDCTIRIWDAGETRRLDFKPYFEKYLFNGPNIEPARFESNLYAANVVNVLSEPQGSDLSLLRGTLAEPHKSAELALHYMRMPNSLLAALSVEAEIPPGAPREHVRELLMPKVREACNRAIQNQSPSLARMLYARVLPWDPESKSIARAIERCDRLLKLGSCPFGIDVAGPDYIGLMQAQIETLRAEKNLDKAIKCQEWFAALRATAAARVELAGLYVQRSSTNPAGDANDRKVDLDQAFQILDELNQADRLSLEMLKDKPDFVPVRDNNRLKAIMKTLEDKKAIQRKRN